MKAVPLRLARAARRYVIAVPRGALAVLGVGALLAAPEVTAELSCRLGKAEATVWTCDLSKDYVTINADYHT